jgi:tetratricopeptide (TPR) repeat protein
MRKQTFGVKGRRLWGAPLVVSFFSLLLCLSIPAFSQSEVSPIEAMLRANQYYEAGQFVEAAQVYEAIIAAGIHHSDLYYNLGNAYFKQGELGRAVLNYRRAQQLTPRDSDVVANLNFARAQTVDQLEANQGGLVNVAQTAAEWLTLNEAVILALFLWVLICYFAVLAILLPRQRRIFGWVMAVVSLCLALNVATIANRLYTGWRYPPAVVVTEKIDITSGPGNADQYVVNFTLHSGAEVQVLENRPGWRRIALSGDLQGWAPTTAVEEIVTP